MAGVEADEMLDRLDIGWNVCSLDVDGRRAASVGSTSVGLDGSERHVQGGWVGRDRSCHVCRGRSRGGRWFDVHDD